MDNAILYGNKVQRIRLENKTVKYKIIFIPTSLINF